VARLQCALRDAGLDGWLFCGFQNRDPLGRRILGLDDRTLPSRRWFYFIPAERKARKLVHRIEPGILDGLPGVKTEYLSWKELQAGLGAILRDASRVAMQYSPMGMIPTVSLVDAGMVDLVRSFGVEVVSSADLAQPFDSCLDEEGLELHLEASSRVHAILDDAFGLIGEKIGRSAPVHEIDVQRMILERFDDAGLTSDGTRPIVAVNEHSGDPHFDLNEGNSSPIGQGDLVLIDLWARLDVPGGIYCDVTWCGSVAEEPLARHDEIFQVVRAARDAGVSLVAERFESGVPLRGCEVDDAVRAVIDRAGFGARFIHRTGHSIGTAGHGTGVNMDNLETNDVRLLLPGCCFSIEPGVYLPDFGVRSEVDVAITLRGEVLVTGPLQERLVTLRPPGS